jgi:cyclophilin family peptidyl-prolyl cis-trans isomerase
MGKFVIELDSGRAPLTVANFPEYVRAGFYNGTVFHRVISASSRRAAASTRSTPRKPTRPAFRTSPATACRIAAARSGSRGRRTHSGNAQFYLNIADNGALDPQPSRWGYAVFGRIVQGMDVVDDIGAVATGEVRQFEKDAPSKR